MAIHKGFPRSLSKRLSVELRERYGAEAPLVLNLWAEPNASLRGVTLRAHVTKGGVERILVGSMPKHDWEEAYQRVLAACLDAWVPADPSSSDFSPASEEPE